MAELVTCVCCTRGRWACVCEALTYFLLQDYPDKELIIFNTDAVPLRIAPEIEGLAAVRVVNAPGEYTSLGHARTAAMEHARGDFYNCWDDDDLWLPWHLSQAMRRVRDTGCLAWKPRKSWWTSDGGKTYEPTENAMEASVVVRTDALKRYGFRDGSGDEHVPWMGGVQEDGGFLVEDVGPMMSYAYQWGQGLHHMSGRLGQPGNFQDHNLTCADHGSGRPLRPASVGWRYRNIVAATGKHFSQDAAGTAKATLMEAVGHDL